MPQLIALALAGAGLYAGYRWVSRELAKAAAAAEKQREDMQHRAAEAQGQPRDLGTLEWDASAGAYRPCRRG